MKKTVRVVIAGFICILFFIIGHVSYLYYLSAAAEYPEDQWLVNEVNRKALIIVAHDDDAISMSATIARLCDQGWDVGELCFYQGYKGRDEIRKHDLDRVASILGMVPPQYHDVELRRDREKVQLPWMPVPYDQFDSLYNKVPAQERIERFIETGQPSVILTLDNIMGGYGHPDHVLISQMVKDYCEGRSQDPSFSVQRIYQAVFDPGMNERILKNMDAFQAAKSVYGISGSPAPDVYISVKGQEERKRRALKAYTTEQNALTKIWPFYNYYPAWIYFGLFDKEYYRVLERKTGFQG